MTIRTCRFTGNKFEINSRDLEFYEKMGVPLPTLCPDERMRRRLAFRNERNLYHRKCDATGKKIISMYSSEAPVCVYDNSYWWGDTWDGLNYGCEFDFTRHFFEQFKKLFSRVPKMARIQQGENVNSEYTNCAGSNKNCFLLFSSGCSEDCLYGREVDECKSCIDNLSISRSELAYECVDCSDSYDIQHCTQVHNSSVIRHSFDCRSCSNCFACVGLRNKNYCILNETVSKDEFKKVLADPKRQKEILSQWRDLYLFLPRLYVPYVNCDDFTGAYLKNCKNAFSCWDSRNLEDCSYCGNFHNAKDCYDIDFYGLEGTNELLYECQAVGWGAFRVLFSSYVWGGSSDVCYSYECFSSSNLFGCAGLKNASFCVLNKQYTEADYHVLKDKIVSHMNVTGEWGEFFPKALSPYAYNESVACETFPMKEDAVRKSGLRWREEDCLSNLSKLEVAPDECSLDMSYDDILGRTFYCKVMGKAYRIEKKELDYYRRYGISPSSLCPDARHFERVKRRQGRKLYSRTCGKCSAAIITTYAPNCLESVYCERCYLGDF